MTAKLKGKDKSVSDFFDADFLVEVLFNNELLPNDLVLLLCLQHQNDNKLKDKSSLLYKYIYYMKELGYEPIEPTHIDRLVDAGYVINLGKRGDQTNINNLKITDKFRELIFPNTDRFDEFFDAYPGIVNKDGKNFILKSVSKLDVEKTYKKKIKNIAEHKKLMEVIQFAKERQLIIMRIDNFLENDYHIELRKFLERDSNISPDGSVEQGMV